MNRHGGLDEVGEAANSELVRIEIPIRRRRRVPCRSHSSQICLVSCLVSSATLWSLQFLVVRNSRLESTQPLLASFAASLRRLPTVTTPNVVELSKLNLVPLVPGVGFIRLHCGRDNPLTRRPIGHGYLVFRSSMFHEPNNVPRTKKDFVVSMFHRSKILFRCLPGDSGSLPPRPLPPFPTARPGETNPSKCSKSLLKKI